MILDEFSAEKQIEPEEEELYPSPSFENAEEEDVEEAEELEEEEEGQNLTVVHEHNTPLPPQLEWVITNTNYKIEIRIWNAEDPRVKQWAFEFFEKSLKAVKGGI